MNFNLRLKPASLFKRLIHASSKKAAEQVVDDSDQEVSFVDAVREAVEASQKAWQDQLDAARDAAASGLGPQPWDRDWIAFQGGVHDPVHEMAIGIGWQRTQDFIEVLDWALASPQGQRALALAGDQTSPWQGPLEMLQEIREHLVDASHEMLAAQADDLEYGPVMDYYFRQALTQLQGQAGARAGGPD